MSMVQSGDFQMSATAEKRQGESVGFPVVTLSTGVRVANFSSPHSFNFDDGSVLPACSAERSAALSLSTEEVVEKSACGRWNDIRLRFMMSESVFRELKEMSSNESVDIILVPFPVMEAIKVCNSTSRRSNSFLNKARVVRVADRVTKAACHDKFCV